MSNSKNKTDSPQIIYGIILFNQDRDLVFSELNENMFNPITSYMLKNKVSKINKDIQLEKGRIVKINYEKYAFTYFVKEKDLCILIVSSENYKEMLLYQLMNEIKDKTDPGFITPLILSTHLKILIRNYNNLDHVDKLGKLNKDIDETIDILHRTIEDVLSRGQKIEHLVDQSSEMMNQSNRFYKESANHNRCCYFL